jgi:excinuclease ABC subunit A
VESLSTYARQFLERLEKPDVDLIEGLSPAIAIEQKTAIHNPRSTVGTVTEIYDFLRLLYARTGTPYCYRCGRDRSSAKPSTRWLRRHASARRARLLILAPMKADPVPTITKTNGSFKKRRDLPVCGWRERFDRVGRGIKLSGHGKETVDVVVDRLIIKPGIRNRLADSMELAISKSDGRVNVHFIGKTDGDTRKIHCDSAKSRMSHCDQLSGTARRPAFLSIHPTAPVRTATASAQRPRVSPPKIVPNPELSCAKARSPFGRIAIYGIRRVFRRPDPLHGVDIYTPYQDLPEAFNRSSCSDRENSRFRFRPVRIKRVAPKKLQSFRRHHPSTGTAICPARTAAKKMPLTRLPGRIGLPPLPWFNGCAGKPHIKIAWAACPSAT